MAHGWFERRGGERERGTSRLGTIARAAAALAGALTALQAAAGDGPAEALTLDAAVELALAGNPGLRAAALAVERDEAGISAARTRYFPQISTNAHAGRLLMPVEMDFDRGAFGSIPGVGPIPDRDVTVESSTDVTFGLTSSIMQPVTQLLQAREGVRLATIGRDADRAQLQAERARIVAEVKRLYHQLVATEGTLVAAREQLATQRELARFAAQQVVQQAALRSDELQAQGAVAAAAVQVRKLESALASGKEQLNRLLGRDVRTPFAPSDAEVAPAEVPDLEEARARAVRDRPELRQAQLLVDKAEADRRMKRWERLPEVSVGVSYSSTFNVENLPRNVAIAGAFVKWDLDWGRDGKEMAQRALAVEEARVRARDAEAGVLVEVGDRLRKLDDARAQVEATRLALEGLRAKAPVVANRYRYQAALLKDALEVQAALTKAAHDHGEALRSLWSAQAELERALGVAP